jgi:hypothetical protein
MIALVLAALTGSRLRRSERTRRQDACPGAFRRVTASFRQTQPYFPPPLWGRGREGGDGNGGARGYPPLQLSPTRGERADCPCGAHVLSRTMTSENASVACAIGSTQFTFQTARRARTRLRDLAACFARGLLSISRPPKLRGRRESRVHAAPAVSCAKCANKNAHEHTGSAEAIRPSLRSGFNGFLRALPGDRAVLPPSSALRSANLTPASGRQDHTTSPSASAPFVKGASASTASRPASVTIASRPSVGRDGGLSASDLPDMLSEIFLKMGLDRGRGGSRTDLPVG